MKSHTSTAVFAPIEMDHASTVFGLWLRAGFAGVLMMLVGGSMLASAGSSTPWAVALLIGGIAAAALAWRRAALVLAGIEPPATKPAPALLKRARYSKSTEAVAG